MATPALSNLSTPLKWAVGGWSLFIIENTILSENRSHLISLLGSDENYHLLYGTCSTIAMGSVGYGYRMVKNAEPLLWSAAAGPSIPGRVASFICLGLGMGMVSQMPPKLQIPVEYYCGGGSVDDFLSQKNTDCNNNELSADVKPSSEGWKVRCPFDFTDNKNPLSNSVSGLERITRHPGLWSFGFLGIGHAFLVPSIPYRVWLSMPLMVALLGGVHTDSRYKRGMGGNLTESYESITSNVPFWAMLSGRQGEVLEVLREGWGEVKGLNAALGLGAAGLWVLTRGRGGAMKKPVVR